MQYCHRGELENMQTRVYAFGNEHLPFDRMAVDVASRLKGVDVVKCTSPDDLLEPMLDESVGQITIIDVVKGIRQPTIITDAKKLKVNGLVSLHDFDVGYFLNLAGEVGLGKKIKIIGVPQEGDAGHLAEEVGRWL